MWGMAERRKKVIDNAWIADGLYAYKISQADLARQAKIDPDKLNKSVKNTRGVTAEEYQRILAVFKEKKSELEGGVNTPSTVLDDTVHRPTPKEGHMGQDGLLAIIGDLTKRLGRVEDDLAEVKKASEPTANPRRGRRTS
jgi:hypothetical protein